MLGWQSTYNWSSSWNLKSLDATSNGSSDLKTITPSLANLEVAIEFLFRCKILIEHITNSNVHRPIKEVIRLDTSLGWRDPIITYLKDGSFPNDKAEAQKLILLPSIHTPRRYLIQEILLQASCRPLPEVPRTWRSSESDAENPCWWLWEPFGRLLSHP